MKDYGKISTYFRENLRTVVPLCITALFFDGLMYFVPILEGQTIDSLYAGTFQTVAFYCLVLISVILFVQINRFFKRYLVRTFANKITLRMRQISLNNLFLQDIGFFGENNAGDILNRNLSDIYDTAEGIRKMTTECFDTFVLLLGYLTMMFIIDWKITILSLPFLVISVIVSQAMKKFAYKNNKAYKEYLSENKNTTITMLDNELYYRGFGVSDNYFKEFAASADILKKKSVKALVFQSSMEPIYMAVALLGLIVVAYFGGIKVIDHTYKIGVFSSLITTYALIGKKTGKIGKLFNAYQTFKVSWQRTRVYMNYAKPPEAKVELKNDKLTLVDFTYVYTDRFQLPKITLEAKKGDIIGVCGRIHTGKTTLLKALSGLYEYRGTARLGDCDITDFKNDKEQHIAFCTGDIALFSDTLENNITLKRDGNLTDALKTSALDEAVSSLGGLDSRLSHSNSNISGGQQKRVQMARALYPASELVLLDDPFQSVDSSTAEKMITRLGMYKDKIIVLVSNNPNILSLVTKIVFLNRKSAVVGHFTDLLKDHDFADLMRLQL